MMERFIKKCKRLLKGSFVIIVVVGMVALVACKKKDAGKTELIFWHGIEAPQNVEVLNKKIAEFNASHPDIVVTAQSYGAADQVGGKIMTAIAGNKQPNLMWWGPAFTGQLAKTGKLVKAQDFISSDPTFNVKDVYDGLWSVGTYKGDIWTVPFDANNLAIYYNKKMFENAQIDPASIETWDDLLDAAKKLTTATTYGFQIPVGKSEWTVWTYQTFLWSAGGKFLSDDNSQVLFNMEAGIDALQFWHDLVNVYKVANFSEFDAGYKTDDFLAGRVAMMINGPWNYPLLKEQSAVEYGAIPIPKKMKHATNIGGENLFIFKTTPKQDSAAWEFAKFIMSKEFQVDWCIASGYLPVSQSTADDPVYKKFLEENPFIAAYVDNMKYGMARPSIPEYSPISLELGKELEKALRGTESPREALDNAANAANKILQEGL